MINPDQLTCYTRNDAQMEELALFATLTAGKPAHRMAKLLESMLANARLIYGVELSPFDIVRIWIDNGILEERLRYYRVGQYTRLAQCWKELTALRPLEQRGYQILPTMVNLRDIKSLERVHGIGPKTARLIVLHSVPRVRAIPIDTHWLKELAERGYPVQADIETITPRLHAIYEQYALQEVDRAMMSCATYDLLVWKKWNARSQVRRAA